MNNIQFEKRKSIEQVEESNELAPKFDSNGLIPVVTTDFSSGELLMQGYMNEEAFKKTIKLGEAVYYSRSRKKIWYKGHDESHWHGTLENDNLSYYFGYWAWEVAAIVKINGIDDTALKNQKYYPYDAVHW